MKKSNEVLVLVLVVVAVFALVQRQVTSPFNTPTGGGSAAGDRNAVTRAHGGAAKQTGSIAHDLPRDEEKRAIQLAKESNIATLDSDLPPERLDHWLSDTFPDRYFSWELNDCGEASGDPSVDAQRDLPLCVEVSTPAASPMIDGIVISLQAGTERRGLFPKPVLRAISQQQGDHFTEIKNLHDLAEEKP